MEYGFLFIVIFFVYIQNILSKQYNGKVQKENAEIGFLFIKVLTATLFLGVIFVFKHSFCWTTFFYAMGFAVSFSICIYGAFMAIKTGPLSLSALIYSFSILLPTLYSIIFYEEDFTKLSISGLILLCISFVLINRIEKDKKINFRWLFFAMLSFLGNGINSILQKVHQETLKAQGLNPNDYAVSFQFFAMLAVTCVFALALLMAKSNNKKEMLKQGLWFAPWAGVANAICNVLMLVLATKLPGVVLYPSVSAGGIVFTFLTALILFKERYTKWQYVGYACGVLSIILLSI